MVLIVQSVRLILRFCCTLPDPVVRKLLCRCSSLWWCGLHIFYSRCWHPHTDTVHFAGSHTSVLCDGFCIGSDEVPFLQRKVMWIEPLCVVVLPSFNLITYVVYWNIQPWKLPKDYSFKKQNILNENGVFAEAGSFFSESVNVVADRT